MSEKDVVKNEKDKIIIKTPLEIGEEHGLEYDTRFGGFWAKKITDVDLTKDKGWALLGTFVPKSYATIISNKEWIVVASDFGSLKYHHWVYKLFRNIDGNLTEIEVNPKDFKDKVPPEIYVKALNSQLYAFAVYIYLEKQKEQTKTS